MNKRIQELAKQATHIEVIHGRGFDTTQYIDRFDKEKFAELIAYECIDLALGSSYREDDMGAIIAKKIQTHFGVEE